MVGIALTMVTVMAVGAMVAGATTLGDILTMVITIIIITDVLEPLLTAQ